MPRFRRSSLYLQPPDMAAAVAALAKNGGTVLAGGTDVYPALGEAPLTGPVIDLSRVAGLAGVRRDGPWWRIGAATTWAALTREPLPPGFDGLKAAAREIGSIQIQNRATIGGNICNASPAADGVPPLLTLDAEVELASARGTRRLPLADFILGNRRTDRAADELLSAVLVPAPAADRRSSFLKLGARRYLVISIAMVAVALEIGDDGAIAAARVAVGSCSAVARRLTTLESALAGAPVDGALAGRVQPMHLAPLAPIDDIRATAAYRREAGLVLIRRALARCAGEAGHAR